MHIMCSQDVISYIESINLRIARVILNELSNRGLFLRPLVCQMRPIYRIIAL